MDDLFRFVTLRPAKPVNPAKVVPVKASPELVNLIANTTSTEARLKELAKYRNPDYFHPHLVDYHYGKAMEEFGLWATAMKELSREKAEQELWSLTKNEAVSLVKELGFQTDVTHLDQTLLIIKYLSDASGANIQELSMARRGYDLVEQLANQYQPVLRHLVLDIPIPPTAVQNTPLQTPATASKGPGDDLDEKLMQLAEAQSSLKNAMRTGFTPKIIESTEKMQPSAAIPPIESETKATTEEKAEAIIVPRRVVSLTPNAENLWLLNEDTVKNFSPAVLETMRKYAGDPNNTSAIALSLRLADARTDLLAAKAKQAFVKSRGLRQIGSNWYAFTLLNPVLGLGFLPGYDLLGYSRNIRPVGVGDLLVVRKHIKAYEGGEVGHIENVLRTEKMSRDTRRLDRTEQTVTIETETNQEEERDTQSTDRSSLKREVDNTVKTDSQMKAGLTVDAKYGPTVEVKSDLQGSYQQQTEDVTKQATEYSKEVVSRSVSKLATKIHQLQTTITLKEFEEKYSHGFDNTASGASNVSGVYQFVDQVYQAKIYNYGKRLMFDVIVPDPAAFYIWAQQKNTAEITHLECPAPFTVNFKEDGQPLTPSDLDEGNYQFYAQAYGATSIDPPPAPNKTVSQTWDAVLTSEPYLFSKSATVTIDNGYSAIQAVARSVGWSFAPSYLFVLVGDQCQNAEKYWWPLKLSGEEGTLPVGLSAVNHEMFTLTLEILCERTSRALQVWQEKTYAAVEQAYEQKLNDYQNALSELQAAQATAVGGRNPEANAAVISTELRKSCIEQLTAQHFDTFGSLIVIDGPPVVDLARLSDQGPYIRFFEEAFEWEHFTYFFYPYFWANQENWAQRSLLDDSDDKNFADFLRAGAARVVFPVRPGFEKAIIHYLDTGMIWNGGDPPDISSSMYVPIIEEIAEAEQRPGNEVSVGDPWDFSVPTQLIKLRKDDSLPTWKKVGENWVPENDG